MSARHLQSDEGLLDAFQRAAFDYFLKEINPRNGLVADRSREGAPASIAVVGFALSSYPVGVERGWMDRAEAAARTLVTLRFFLNSPQSEMPDATGYKGFYYHFLDLKSGKRVWQSELSLVDTAFLLAGILTAGVYFDRNVQTETEIRELSDALYHRMDWRWAQNGKPSVSQGWKPEFGFLHYGWEGYDEAAILYVLGLASPTHPLSEDSFQAWTSTYQWENIYGHDVLYSGPLFTHQYSHAWIDFRGIQDQFMREKKCDYFENTRRAIYIQREYAIRNPYDFKGYGENCWGLSACDGPGHKIRRINDRERRFLGYAARGVPFGPDDGTTAPSAALASLPFTPEIALSAVRHLCDRYPEIARGHRMPSAVNPTFPGDNPEGWISEGYLGLDQGLIVMMIENYRSQLIWKLMKKCPYIRKGLRRAGFKRGWL
ncbi:MAG TPA: glucoamylase family protein [Candidatus Acidoferrales bacterium]|jgi:hypothetical protein|nr:glucoamylase family protein [Candidatus Acidoferrales bacterium]